MKKRKFSIVVVPWLMAIALLAFLILRQKKSTNLNDVAVLPDAQRSESSTNHLASQILERVREWKWGELIGTNYGQYIENLRSVNCPELTITSLVIGDVNRSARDHL